MALRGLGIGWRPELAWFIARREDLAFVEIIAETFWRHPRLSEPLQQLREQGVAIVPHAVSLSLGGAELLDMTRVDALARLAPVDGESCYLRLSTRPIDQALLAPVLVMKGLLNEAL